MIPLREVHGVARVQREDATDTAYSLRVHDHEHGCLLIFGPNWSALLTPEQARWIGEALYASARRYEDQANGTQS